MEFKILCVLVFLLMSSCGDDTTIEIKNLATEIASNDSSSTDNSSEDNSGDSSSEETPPPVPEFITSWNVDISSDDTITLPLYSYQSPAYNFTVDWGDGEVETYSSDDPGFDYEDVSHQYSTSDTYDIKISGVFPYFKFKSVVTTGEDNDKLIDVKNWGAIEWQGLGFVRCSNITTFTATDTPNLSNVTSFYQIFYKATNFNSDIGNWDVSNITNMTFAFAETNLFNQDISGWKMEQVTQASNMFTNAKAFNQNIGGWDVGGITDFTNFFKGAESFNQDIRGWDVSSSTNFWEMFTNASVFNNGFAAGESYPWTWNTTNVTEMRYMFYKAYDFNGDISGWTTDNVTNMTNMFYLALKFNQDISGWNVSNVGTDCANFATNANNAWRSNAAYMPSLDASCLP